MDDNRFDALARSVAAPATRRGALRSLAGGGLLAALGLKAAPAAAQQDGGGTCVLDFAVTVRQGPNTGRPAGQLRGELSFGLSRNGTLEDASLRLADGTDVPVVGQATGHSLQVRLQLGANQTVVAMGVGAEEIAACQGAVDGLVTGPAVGDLGDWHAVVLRSTGTLASGVDGAGGRSGGAGTGGGQGGAAGTGGGGRQGGQGTAQGGGDRGGGGSGGGGGRNRTGAAGATGASGATRSGGASGASGASGATGAAGATGATGATGAAGRCATGLTDCSGTCADLSRDPRNCGACGNVCASGLVAVECRDGTCAEVRCPVGQEFCGAADGCRDLLTDPNHCGACGNACGDAFCVTGSCVATQPTAPDCTAQGLTDCGGSCIDTTGDPTNCGACGNSCATGEVCAGGACTAQVDSPPLDCVPQGLTICDNVCVDVLTDPTRCGDCLTVCAVGEQCVGGVCTAPAAVAGPGAGTCPDGEVLCGGTCSNPLTDFGNCGACGNVCAAAQECAGGVCNDPPAPAVCAPGQIECTPGSCTDPQTDQVNCGACGNVCPNQCAGGVCS